MSTAASPVGSALRWLAGVALLVAYAVLCFRAAASTAPDTLDAAVAIAPFVVLAWAAALRSAKRTVAVFLCLLATALLGWGLPHLAQHAAWLLLLQHAGIYVALGWTFARTLRPGHEPLVSWMARWGRPDGLPPAVARYTRQVTAAWALGFAAIAGMSVLLFATAPATWWATYLNVASPLLLAAMFAGEYGVRCLVVPRAERAGAREALRAGREAWAAWQRRRA